VSTPVPLRRFAPPLVALLLLAGASGCGGGFDPQSELNSLRVLGVQKDRPYVVPGESVTLTLHWYDASENREQTIGGASMARPVERLWLPPCISPPGNLFYACFEQYAQMDVSALAELGTGDSFSIDVPSDLLSRQPTPPPGQPLFATIFGFFVVCAGRIGFDPTVEAGAIPIVCLDQDDNPLGADDFVIGYTTLYAFANGLRNANPVIDGFEIAGKDALFCRDRVEAEEDVGLCVPNTDPIDLDCNELGAACVASCEDDGDPACPDIDVRPRIDQAMNAERDEVSRLYYDRDVGEQMWINYYTDRGGLKSEVRLLSDAVSGWNEDYGTTFYAPREPGPVTIWAVAHDNRGGVAWAEARIQVED
jgi:hypothetical protein